MPTATETKKLNLLVDVTFVAAHYNRNAQANIPAVWEASVIDGLPQPPHGHLYAYYVDETRDAALAGLVKDLQERGLHGTIRVMGGR